MKRGKAEEIETPEENGEDSNAILISELFDLRRTYLSTGKVAGEHSDFIAQHAKETDQEFYQSCIETFW